MAKRSSAPGPQGPPERDNRLSQRWAIILAAGAAAAFIANTAGGPFAAITAFVLVAGLLHTILA